MPTPLHLLIVEDSEDDTVLILLELRRGGYDPSFLRVDTAEALQTALDRQTWDLIICDYSMPHFSGLAALRIFQESGLDIPFIVVSGTIGEDVAVNTMLAGAHDYIMKGQLSRLVPAIQRELREALQRQARKQAEEALESAEAYSAQIITNTPVIICGIALDGTIRYQSCGRTDHRIRADELVEQNAWQLFYPGDSYRQVEGLLRGFESGDVRDYEMVLTTQSGEKRAILWNLTSQHDENGNLVEIVGFGSDITRRKQAEEALRGSEEKYRTLFETSTDAIFVETMDGRILDCNQRASVCMGTRKRRC
jgi:PAS domain S-box-containing protein